MWVWGAGCVLPLLGPRDVCPVQGNLGVSAPVVGSEG